MNEFAGAIIKPDALNDSLDTYILRDLENVGLKVRFRKILRLNESQMIYMYPDKIWTDRYPYALHSVTHGPAMIILLEGDDIYRKLLQEKWDWNKPWIRLRYKKYFEDELSQKGLSENEIHLRLCENRIHSCDDLMQTVQLMSWLLTYDELSWIQSISHDLYERIKMSRILMKI